MVLESLHPLRDFGTRSRVTHAIMAVTFAAAVASAFLLEGQLGLVSFVAFVNFTAGMWVCQSVHALGNAFVEGETYEGVLHALRGRR